MDMQHEIGRMRMDLLHASPFYGTLLLHIPVRPDESVPTACTNGRVIRYNPGFMSSLKPEERRFVLMHELIHVLLRHPSRCRGGNPFLQNVAADMVVNNICSTISRSRDFRTGFRMVMPPQGISPSPGGLSMEELYARLVDDQLKKGEDLRKGSAAEIWIRKDYGKDGKGDREKVLIPAPGAISTDRNSRALGSADLEEDPRSPAEQKLAEKELRRLIQASLKGDPGAGISSFVPREVRIFAQSRPLPWKRLLRDFLDEVRDDDASYATPERKYIHMDLIIPGHGLTEEQVREMWVFVDSSGSISPEEIGKFLSELYHLIRDMRCVLHIAYWDTSVTDVYRNIDTVAKLRECRPNHSGGTNINCVYQWIEENKIKPDVMVILTDGWFGMLLDRYKKRKLRDRTILVLSQDSVNMDKMREIGRTAVLGGK